MMEYVHIINGTYQQLNKNQIYALTEEYTTTELEKDTAERLQEETSILYNSQKIFNHQKAILTTHGLFPLNLKKPILKGKKEKNKERTIIRWTDPYTEKTLKKLQQNIMRRHRKKKTDINVTYLQDIKNYPLTNEHGGSTLSTTIQGKYTIQPKEHITVELPFKMDIPLNQHVTIKIKHKTKPLAAYRREIIRTDNNKPDSILIHNNTNETITMENPKTTIKFYKETEQTGIQPTLINLIFYSKHNNIEHTHKEKTNITWKDPYTDTTLKKLQQKTMKRHRKKRQT